MLFLAIFAIFFNKALATNVYYSGVSYIGTSENIDKRFRYTNKLNQKVAGVYLLDSQLYSRIKKDELPFTLVSDQLANINDEESLSFTLALQNEAVSIEKIGSQFKILIQLDAELLFFNYRSMTIATNYPVRVQLNEVSDTEPSQADILRLLSLILFETPSDSLFDNAVAKLMNINPAMRAANTIQVVNSNVKDNALKFASEYSEDHRKYLSEYFAQSLSQQLSSNQQISVLPFIKDHAIGNKLAGRYASGEVFSMQIPDPDYAIDLEVLAFKKQLYSEQVAGKSFIYASQAKFRFYEPLSGKTYFEEKLFNGATKVIPASQSVVDDWLSYQEALIVLFDKFTQQLSQPDKKWLKKHAGNTKQFKAFKNLSKVIESCR